LKILRVHVDPNHIVVLYDDWTIATDHSARAKLYTIDNLMDYDYFMNGRICKNITHIYTTKWGRRRYGKRLNVLQLSIGL